MGHENWKAVLVPGLCPLWRAPWGGISTPLTLTHPPLTPIVKVSGMAPFELGKSTLSEKQMAGRGKEEDENLHG